MKMGILCIDNLIILFIPIANKDVIFFVTIKCAHFTFKLCVQARLNLR